MILIASVFVINNLTRSIYFLWQKRSLVEDARLEVENEKKRNQELQSKLTQVKDQEFVEEEARNKLFLVRPDEQVVILPEKAILDATISATPVPLDTRPNWKKWWDRFF